MLVLDSEYSRRREASMKIGGKMRNMAYVLIAHPTIFFIIIIASLYLPPALHPPLFPTGREGELLDTCFVFCFQPTLQPGAPCRKQGLTPLG